MNKNIVKLVFLLVLVAFWKVSFYFVNDGTFNKSLILFMFIQLLSLFSLLISWLLLDKTKKRDFTKAAVFQLIATSIFVIFISSIILTIGFDSFFQDEGPWALMIVVWGLFFCMPTITFYALLACFYKNIMRAI